MSRYYRDPAGGLQELRVGEYLTINGERRRVLAVTVEPAAEDDPELGVQAGDPVTTVELGGNERERDD